MKFESQEGSIQEHHAFGLNGVLESMSNRDFLKQGVDEGCNGGTFTQNNEAA
jgi:hypothetical protein